MKTLFNLLPQRENARSSEGDFALLPNGRILFAFSRFVGASEDHAPSDIAGIFSDDNGKSFTQEPEILISASEHNTKNIMSVSMLDLKNGEIGIFYLVKCSDGRSEYVLRRTKDGKNFSEPVLCMPKTSANSYYVVNNGRVLRTKEGRIIVPAALHRNPSPDFSHFDTRGVIVFFYSDDDGLTWHEGQDIIYLPHSAQSHTGLQEPGLAQLPNSSLYAYMRTDLYCQYESISADNLKSWTPAQPSKFSSPASPLSIRQNPYTEEYFAVWNPIPNYYGRKIEPLTFGRTPLIMARSKDCRDFSNLVVLEDDKTKGFCYPSLFFPNKKTLLISYCYGGKEDGGFLNCLKIISLEI